jgi:hypothetical protein
MIRYPTNYVAEGLPGERSSAVRSFFKQKALAIVDGIVLDFGLDLEGFLFEDTEDWEDPGVEVHGVVNAVQKRLDTA